jgi:putative transcriptional regulator
VDDVFTPEPDDLWHLVLSRQAQPLSWLAHYPEDPSVN